jgi:predicted transcriptional regulator
MTEKNQPKTISFSMRLDARAAFILKLLAHVNGQSQTTVMEQALTAYVSGNHRAKAALAKWDLDNPSTDNEVTKYLSSAA